MQSIGLIEAYGITAAINAADAMCKAAGVTLAGYKKIGSAMVTVYVYGEVAAVQIAVQNGIEAANRVGRVISSLVIPRPDQSVIDSLNELASKKSKRKSFLYKKPAFASKANTASQPKAVAPISPPLTVIIEEVEQEITTLAEAIPVAPATVEKTLSKPEKKVEVTKIKTQTGKKVAQVVKRMDKKPS